jgi:hypothetical protein
VLLHFCNFRWAKKITLSHETGIFKPDMKMLKVHQNAPTSMLKSYIFSGVIPPDPRIKKGGEGGEGLGRVGKGGNRCLAHPKIIPWRPLCPPNHSESPTPGPQLNFDNYNPVAMALMKTWHHPWFLILGSKIIQHRRMQRVRQMKHEAVSIADDFTNDANHRILLHG